MSDLFAWIRKSIEFGSPEYLMFVPLAAACLALGVVVRLVRLRYRAARTYGSSYPILGRIKFWFAGALILSVTAAAAARPSLAFGGSKFKRGNIDVLFVIDSSASMWVKDLGPSRLDIAIREASNLHGQDILRAGDRAGLFVFGTAAIRKVHISTNVDRLMDVVGKLGPPKTLTGDSFPWDSDVATALEHIRESVDTQDRFEAGESEEDWEPTKRSDRAVILFSDGDFPADAELTRRVGVALAEFQRRGLVIYPVGIGSRTGLDLTTILRDYKPGRDYDETLEADLKEAEDTRLNTETLSVLAQRTGGKMFAIDNVGKSATGFFRTVFESHRPISFQLTSDQRKQEAWQYLVAAAIVLFALAVLFY